MSSLSIVSLALLWLRVAAANAVIEATFELYDNGSSRNGASVTLSEADWDSIESGLDSDGAPPPGEAFAVDMSGRIRVSKWKAPEPVVSTRAYREDGELIVDFEQLLPSAAGGDPAPRRVYLVADDMEFIWPFVEYGHRQIVSRNVVPLVDGEPVVLESLSERPRVFRIHNMATGEESAALISTALNATGADALQRSTVGSGQDADGNDVKKEDIGRTSDNAWDHQSPAAKAMVKRSFQITNIAEDEGKRDGLQIVRYQPGQGYNTHPDYFTGSDDRDFSFNPYEGGSNRFATVFMYLNDPDEGGATVFPRVPGVENLEMPEEARAMFKPHTWENTVNEQCYSKLAVTPKLGTAALFYSILPDGRIDPQSHHAACPLIKGEKWGANIWIWNKQRYGEIRTGGPRTVQMVNNSGETVYISWEGKPSGTMVPGGTIPMSSFEFHRFRASFGSHRGAKFAEFTVQSEPDAQVWEISRPRHYQQRVEGTATDAATAYDDDIDDYYDSDDDYDDSDDIDGAATSAANDHDDGSTNGIQVRARNRSGETISILWQDNSWREEMSMGTVGAGQEMQIKTFEGHHFVASLLSQEQTSLIYEVKGKPMVQEWDIDFEEKRGNDEL